MLLINVYLTISKYTFNDIITVSKRYTEHYVCMKYLKIVIAYINTISNKIRLRATKYCVIESDK